MSAISPRTAAGRERFSGFKRAARRVRQRGRGIAIGHRRCIRAGLEPPHEQLRTGRSRTNLAALPAGSSDSWALLRAKLQAVPDVLTFEWPTVFAPARDRPILFTAAAWADVLLTLDRRDFADLLGTSFYGLAILKPGDFLQRERTAGRLIGRV